MSEAWCRSIRVHLKELQVYLLPERVSAENICRFVTYVTLGNVTTFVFLLHHCEAKKHLLQCNVAKSEIWDQELMIFQTTRELHFQKQLTTKLLISNQVFMGKCWCCINLLSTNTYSISLKVTWGLFPSPCPWRAAEADSNLERSKFILSAVLPSNPSVINLLINPKGQLLRTRLVSFSSLHFHPEPHLSLLDVHGVLGIQGPLLIFRL